MVRPASLSTCRTRSRANAPGPRRRPWPAPALCLLLAALAPGCDKDRSTGPVAGEPSDDLPQVSADLFALAAEVRGAGVDLHWEWSDKNPYRGAQVERRLGEDGARAVIAGPLRWPLVGWVDPDVANGAAYAYRLRACGDNGEVEGLTPWVTVAIDAAPVFSVNGGDPVAGASPVRADLLATSAEAMRLAWGPDPTQEAWQPPQRTFELEPPASSAYTVSCQVRYPDGTLSAVLTRDFVLDLTAPQACFLLEVFPATRSVRVDASRSEDGEGICPASELDFHWTWGDGQGVDRGARSGATHAYAAPGLRTITLTVTDWAGHAAQISQEAELSNRSPAAPALQAPEDAVQDVSRLPRFQWSGSVDLEGDAVAYTLHLGTAEPLPVAAEGLTTASWEPEIPLAAETTYAWRVTATDTWGGRSESATTSFHTAANSPPGIPDEPYPENWQERVSTWPILSWSPCLDPEAGDVRYDVYFGPTLPLELVVQNLETASFQPEPLAAATGYLWKVVARDPEGAESCSRTWRFETGVAPAVPLAAVRPGAFTMGSAAAGGAGNPPHEVALSRAYWLGTHEVTNAQYLEMLMRAQARLLVEYDDGRVLAHGQVLVDLAAPGCRLERRGRGYGVTAGYEEHPVVAVTWCGAAAFCDWMNDCEGLPASYAQSEDLSGAWELAAGGPTSTAGYRLPTEAEWEFATQAGGAAEFPWGASAPTCALANGAGCADGLSPVGSFPAAPAIGDVGFHDLAGNAAEWCGDWWQADLGGAGGVDPGGPATGTCKAVRGGGYDASAEALHCAWRTFLAPGDGSVATGFRVARSAGY